MVSDDGRTPSAHFRKDFIVPSRHSQIEPIGHRPKSKGCYKQVIIVAERIDMQFAVGEHDGYNTAPHASPSSGGKAGREQGRQQRAYIAQGNVGERAEEARAFELHEIRCRTPLRRKQIKRPGTRTKRWQNNSPKEISRRHHVLTGALPLDLNPHT